MQDVGVDEAPEAVLPSLEVAAVALGAFLVAILLGRLLVVPALGRVVARRNPDNETVVEGVQRFATLVVLFAALAVALLASGFGHLLSGSALVVAAATLAVGVAGQEVIGNLVSGLFLVSDPEFNVGDWIVWEDGQGHVEAIRFRVTRVRNGDGEVITVPNTTLATTAIARPYSRDRARIGVRVGVALQEDVDAAEDVLRAAVDGVDGALSTPAPRVVVDELGDDALWLRALFWVGDPTRVDVVEARSAYLRELRDGLEAAGVAYSPPSDHAITGELDVVDATDEGEVDPGD